MNEEHKSYVDKLIGDEGLQFSVTANLAPENYIRMGLVVVGAIVLGHALNLIIDNVVKR